MKLLLQRLEKLSVDEKPKSFARDVETKAVRKQLGGEKRNLSIEQEEPFLKK